MVFPCYDFIEQKVEKLKRVAGATSRTGIYTV